MKRFIGTPGPWSLDEFDNVVHGNVNGWGRKESVRVSGVCLPGRVTEEYAANTRLVSAAPDLLEALQGYMSAVSEMNEAMKDGYNVQGAMTALIGWEDMARAAISKALGEE